MIFWKRWAESLGVICNPLWGKASNYYALCPLHLACCSCYAFILDWTALTHNSNDPISTAIILFSDVIGFRQNTKARKKTDFAL